MKIFELKCEALLKSDIYLKDSFSILSKFINYAVNQNKKIEFEDKNSSINNYCFGNFYPIESDKFYKKDKSYKFIIRSIDKELIDQLVNTLYENVNNEFIKIVGCEKREIEQFFINELYSATPVIISDRRDKNGKQLFWSLDYNGNMEVLEKRLQKNLEKKLKLFCSEDIDISESFIEKIEIKNQKPQSIYFKTKKNQEEKVVRLIGNKFRIIPNKDEVSQKLAFLSLAVGLGEKSSLGGGFCLSR